MKIYNLRLQYKLRNDFINWILKNSWKSAHHSNVGSFFLKILCSHSWIHSNYRGKIIACPGSLSTINQSVSPARGKSQRCSSSNRIILQTAIFVHSNAWISIQDISGNPRWFNHTKVDHWVSLSSFICHFICLSFIEVQLNFQSYFSPALALVPCRLQSRLIDFYYSPVSYVCIRPTVCKIEKLWYFRRRFKFPLSQS